MKKYKLFTITPNEPDLIGTGLMDWSQSTDIINKFLCDGWNIESAVGVPGSKFGQILVIASKVETNLING